jgi:fibronectin type 3 domain-containing protein
MNKWEHLAKVDGRLQVEYIDDDLDNEEEGKYRITAYNFKDIASKPSTAVVGKTKALPLSPTDVKASNNLAKKIELSWSPSPTEDVIKYAIYRSPFQSIGFSQEYEVKADTLNLVDTVNDDDKKYYYKVYAVDKDGLYSNMKVDSTEGKTLGKPAKP